MYFDILVGAPEHLGRITANLIGIDGFNIVSAALGKPQQLLGEFAAAFDALFDILKRLQVWLGIVHVHFHQGNSAYDSHEQIVKVMGKYLDWRLSRRPMPQKDLPAERFFLWPEALINGSEGKTMPEQPHKIVRSSSLRSDTNMWPGAWVMTRDRGADVAASCEVTPQAQNTGISPG